MSKSELAAALNLVSQTLPFLMITATFIVIAYGYGYTLSPNAEHVFESSRINFNHLL